MPRRASPRSPGNLCQRSSARWLACANRQVSRTFRPPSTSLIRSVPRRPRQALGGEAATYGTRKHSSREPFDVVLSEVFHVDVYIVCAQCTICDHIVP